MLKGLFDRPVISPQQQAINALQSAYSITDPTGGDGGINYDPCGPGYVMDVTGFCVPVNVYFGSPSPTPAPISVVPITDPNAGSTSTTSSSGDGTVIVNNSIAITDAGIQAVADAVNNGITTAAENSQNVAEQAAKSISAAVTEETDAITQGIAAATTNLGNEVTITTATLAATTAATVGTAVSSIDDLIGKVKDAITPILTSIGGFVHTVDLEVQNINDTLIQPIVSLYNSTIGTIANLTQAIETDLHDGLSGLLLIPGQLADQLGSFDASLQRTVEQLGTVNSQTVTSGITFLGESFPGPMSDALSKSLSGSTLTDQLKTTFADPVTLTSETLTQVSGEAISGIGGLLSDILHIITSTFKTSLDQLHGDWKDVDSVFVGLLDGALGLLTTVTAMGALAAPLIDAAEQQARILVPTAKLDPVTVITALQRKFLSATDATSELVTTGLDPTRIKVLTDLSMFLADANMALDWWYRGIIGDDDLTANLQAHGFEPEDIDAYKAGSVFIPALADLIRWLNFGIITQDQFASNMKVMRYDDGQIQAILTSYQDRETAQTLSQLDGILNSSSAGFLNSTLNLPVPATVQLAGQRQGLHPDLTRYVWLSHWQIPEVQTFIQAYFRGIRTLTEVQQRMTIANIPPELWDDLIETARPLIPFRSIPSFISKGYLTQEEGQSELAAHGYDLHHQQILLASVAMPKSTVTATAATTIHTLSIANARELWGMGAISDSQYTTILEAHGYTSDTAALQLKADSVSEHVKAQKATLVDYTAQVESGTMTLDDATQQLTLQGFSSAQVSKFTLAIAKYQKISQKIPSIGDLNKFLKAQLITLDQYTQALQTMGWADPWLSAYIGLVSSGGVAATTDSTGA